MFKSEHFGRAFWVDVNNDFRSCPLFNNNEPDLDHIDYVSEWTDLEGVDLNKLFNIHRIELFNKTDHGGLLQNSDFKLTEDVYKEVKKCYNNDNLEDNYSYIDSLLTTGI
tara:strand:+ start:354 stop:683 length:330 start_codon:yes stop_codon:yes gene_type:complete